MAIISVIIYDYYDALLKHIDSANCFSSAKKLNETRKIHLAIKKFVLSVKDFLSPLVLVTIGCNVLYILAYLFSGLEADIHHPNIIVRINFFFTIFYQFLKIGFSVYLAARFAEMVFTQWDAIFNT